MDVFDLSSTLVREYESFSRSFVSISAEDLREKVDQGYESRRFWPAPLIQINPHYKSGGRLSELVGSSGLAAETARIFRRTDALPSDPDPSLNLHRHQAQAIELALSGKSFVVTTGTGSGKSLCFFIPIVDAILKAKRQDAAPCTRAIVIYPMNALANSQMEELRRFLGADGPVRFARYTGQESEADRIKIRDRAPDILLTNFMMLELLMTRQNELDRKVLANCRRLRFVVLDELHTYRGRQGADVAMLMRRLKARLCAASRPPLAIGTSATMSSAEDETERNRAVADVASCIFGTPIGPDAVITETLRRATDHTRSADRELAGLREAVERAAQQGVYAGRMNAELAQDPLAIWVETRLGLKNVDIKPERARPVPVETAAELLSADSGTSPEACALALRQALLAYSLTEQDRGVAGGGKQPLFAFRLHQLISGAGRLYVTLDPPGERTVTFDGQIYDPDHPEKLLFATHFCRRCGQEHHPVFLVDDQGQLRLEKREIDDVPVEGEDDPDLGSRRWGFLMPEPTDDDFVFGGAPEDYPEPWQEATKGGAVRLKSTYRNSRAEALQVLPDGRCGSGGRRAWFLPGRFKFCPACGDYHTDSTRDINRLASLSAEGRSSATTVLITAVLRWMHGAGTAALRSYERKLLAFTDNRQDAALQAGHFNDFVFVTLLRGAILAALDAAGDSGLTPDSIGIEMQKALGFLGDNENRRHDWMAEPDIKGAGRLDAERAMREGLAHRFWIDQRRGWRFTNPNLEQLGMVAVDYVSLAEMCEDDQEFTACEPLAAATPEERRAAARALLDTLRRGLAVETDSLDRTMVEALAARMRTSVKPPWSIAEDRVRGATTLVVDPPKRADIKLADEAYLLRGSARSALGREIRKLRFNGAPPLPKQVGDIINGLIAAARAYGLIVARPSPVGGGEGWRLNANVVVFRAGDGGINRPNPFFCDLYRAVARLLSEGGQALFEFEGREHTAQVDPFRREMREARFRYGKEDQDKLRDRVADLKSTGEDARFLPTLFCSPTMELGVDISSMNVVYLRNMPPTPANYVQRSGRAGRSGQAALILSYCAAQSPHDQYFFRNPSAMVAGVVKAPTIDLANKDLVDSHLHAEWLAASGVALWPNIPQNLDMTSPGLPLAEHVRSVSAAPQTVAAGVAAIVPVLQSLAPHLEGASWYTGAEAYARSIAEQAAVRLDDTFARWRELFAAAEAQRDEADRVLKDYSISAAQRKAAQTRQAQAHGQINLLLGGSERVGSDFYVYRYLATEGFLPGYNFPRLPLMAFIPGESDHTRDRYLQRARFLAISEFGPGSLVYHEGRAYRVDRALLGTAGDAEGRLVTFATAVCPACGAGHDEEDRESCHVCGHPLAKAHLIRDLFRIDNVGTRPAERITANDEDRRRQGFDLQTTVQMPADASRVDVDLIDAEGSQLASITFAPAARIRRINRGLRRRRDETEVGFLINPRTGRWLGRSAGESGDVAPVDQPQRITPVVEDRKNALLIRLPERFRAEAGAEVEALMVTLQHALGRGIGATFQLEEGEILGEPTPHRTNRKALLFYEAAEGGAGALGRLVREIEQFRALAREALLATHLTKDSIDNAAVAGPEALMDTEDTKCVAGCYQCLLSYYNQPDHTHIDRRLPGLRAFLVRLLSASFAPADTMHTVPADELGGLPPTDAEPLRVDGVDIPLVWRRQRVVAVETTEMTAGLAAGLEDRGLEVVVLPSEAADRAAALADLVRRLGGTA